MKYKVLLTDGAEADLRGIYEYITFVLFQPMVAAKQLDRIENSIASLDQMPDRYKAFDKEPWYSRGLHQLSVDNFIIFYIPKIADRIVVIIRIMYGGRDIDEQLKKTDY